MVETVTLNQQARAAMAEAASRRQPGFGRAARTAGIFFAQAALAASIVLAAGSLAACRRTP